MEDEIKQKEELAESGPDAEPTSEELVTANARLAELEQAIAGKDNEITALKQARTELEGRVTNLSQSLAEAVAGYKEGGLSVWERVVRFYLAEIHYREGNFREALAEIDRIEQLGMTQKLHLAQSEVHLQRALVHTAMGDRQQGENFFSLAAEALSEGDKGTKAWQRLVSLYRGQMDFMTGNFGQAIDLLQRFLSMIPYQHNDMRIPSSRRSDCLYMIALAHYRLGDLQSALRELEEIPTLTYGLYWNPQALARSYLLAGQIYQKLGQKEKALEKYRLFVDIWKDCDPPLRPLVNEARREIVKLEKQG